jgi:hypothetical protein
MFNVPRNARRGLKMVLAGCGALVLANCMGGPTEEADAVPAGGELGKDGQMIVKDVFVRDQDMKLEKGKMVPKGTYILKPGETEEYYIKTSSGPWEFGGLAKRAVSGNRYYKMPAGQYIKEIRVIRGASNASCPSGTNPSYVRNDIDLNRGAGGDYLFFCVATSAQPDLPIVQHIRIDNSSSGTTFNAGKPTTVSQGLLGIGTANSDLNQTAGGDYVWGRFDYGGCKVTGFGVAFKDHWWESVPLPSGFVLSDETDLNYGSGGAYLWAINSSECP